MMLGSLAFLGFLCASAAVVPKLQSVAASFDGQPTLQERASFVAPITLKSGAAAPSGTGGRGPAESRLAAGDDVSSELQWLADDRFERADADGNGCLSEEELRSAWGADEAEATWPQTAELLRGMAEAMDFDVDQQICRNESRSYLAQASSNGLLIQKLLESAASATLEYFPGRKCGAEPATVGEFECRYHGAYCLPVDYPVLFAFLANRICESAESSSCVCTPGPRVKQLARTGVAGILAMQGAHPQDEARMPMCGPTEQWTKDFVEANLSLSGPEFDPLTSSASATSDEVNNFMANLLGAFFKVGGSYFRFWQEVVEATFAEVEASIFHNADQKTCMITWLASESQGDYRANFARAQRPFGYGPGKVHVGYRMMYDVIHDQLQERFDAVCCGDGAVAETFIVSGHSMGGCLALMNAADMVRNWQCGGVDLTGANLNVVAVAPAHSGDREFAAEHYSCQNPARCLAGSAVLFADQRDFAANTFDFTPMLRGSLPESQLLDEVFASDARYQLATFMQPAKQPVAVTPYKGRCPHFPRPAVPGDEPGMQTLNYCHSMFVNAQRITEDFLIGEEWGTTCTSCGNWNVALQAVQLEQYHIAANPEYVPTPVEDEPTCSGDICRCPQAWDPCWARVAEEGRCVNYVQAR